MGESEHGWEPEHEWHPMFRAYMGEIKWHFWGDDEREAWTCSWMDYAPYWEQQRQRDADGLPEVWRGD